jgi:hypothetical protein
MGSYVCVSMGHARRVTPALYTLDAPGVKGREADREARGHGTVEEAETGNERMRELGSEHR